MLPPFFPILVAVVLLSDIVIISIIAIITLMIYSDMKVSLSPIPITLEAEICARKFRIAGSYKSA